jgi:hypothetical protein
VYGKDLGGHADESEASGTSPFDALIRVPPDSVQQPEVSGCDSQSDYQTNQVREHLVSQFVIDPPQIDGYLTCTVAMEQRTDRPCSPESDCALFEQGFCIGYLGALRYGSRSSNVVTGLFAVSSSLRPSRTTWRWRSVSNGAEMGRPMRWGVKSTRAGFMASVRPRKTLDMMMTVGIPTFSNSLLTCPTDKWQSGQTGTSTAASQPSSLTFVAHSGAFSRESLSWDVTPINE